MMQQPTSSFSSSSDSTTLTAADNEEQPQLQQQKQRQQSQFHFMAATSSWLQKQKALADQRASVPTPSTHRSSSRTSRPTIAQSPVLATESKSNRRRKAAADACRSDARSNNNLHCYSEFNSNNNCEPYRPSQENDSLMKQQHHQFSKQRNIVGKSDAAISQPVKSIKGATPSVVLRSSHKTSSRSQSVSRRETTATSSIANNDLSGVVKDEGNCFQRRRSHSSMSRLARQSSQQHEIDRKVVTDVPKVTSNAAISMRSSIHQPRGRQVVSNPRSPQQKPLRACSPARVLSPHHHDVNSSHQSRIKSFSQQNASSDNKKIHSPQRIKSPSTHRLRQSQQQPSDNANNNNPNITTTEPPSGYYPPVWDVVFETAERQILRQRGTQQKSESGDHKFVVSLEDLSDVALAHCHDRRDTILTLSRSSIGSRGSDHNNDRVVVEEDDDLNFTPFLNNNTEEEDLNGEESDHSDIRPNAVEENDTAKIDSELTSIDQVKEGEMATPRKKSHSTQRRQQTSEAEAVTDDIVEVVEETATIVVVEPQQPGEAQCLTTNIVATESSASSMKPSLERVNDHEQKQQRQKRGRFVQGRTRDQPQAQAPNNHTTRRSPAESPQAHDEQHSTSSTAATGKRITASSASLSRRSIPHNDSTTNNRRSTRKAIGTTTPFQSDRSGLRSPCLSRSVERVRQSIPSEQQHGNSKRRTSSAQNHHRLRSSIQPLALTVPEEFKFETEKRSSIVRASHQSRQQRQQMASPHRERKMSNERKTSAGSNNNNGTISSRPPISPTIRRTAATKSSPSNYKAPVAASVQTTVQQQRRSQKQQRRKGTESPERFSSPSRHRLAQTQETLADGTPAVNEPLMASPMADKKALIIAPVLDDAINDVKVNGEEEKMSSSAQQESGIQDCCKSESNSVVQSSEQQQSAERKKITFDQHEGCGGGNDNDNHNEEGFRRTDTIKSLMMRRADTLSVPAINNAAMSPMRRGTMRESKPSLAAVGVSLSITSASSIIHQAEDSLNSNHNPFYIEDSHHHQEQQQHSMCLVVPSLDDDKADEHHPLGPSSSSIHCLSSFSIAAVSGSSLSMYETENQHATDAELIRRSDGEVNCYVANDDECNEDEAGAESRTMGGSVGNSEDVVDRRLESSMNQQHQEDEDEERRSSLEASRVAMMMTVTTAVTTTSSSGSLLLVGDARNNKDASLMEDSDGDVKFCGIEREAEADGELVHHLGDNEEAAHSIDDGTTTIDVVVNTNVVSSEEEHHPVVAMKLINSNGGGGQGSFDSAELEDGRSPIRRSLVQEFTQDTLSCETIQTDAEDDDGVVVVALSEDISESSRIDDAANTLDHDASNDNSDYTHDDNAAMDPGSSEVCASSVAAPVFGDFHLESFQSDTLETVAIDDPPSHSQHLTVIGTLLSDLSPIEISRQQNDQESNFVSPARSPDRLQEDAIIYYSDDDQLRTSTKGDSENKEEDSPPLFGAALRNVGDDQAEDNSGSKSLGNQQNQNRGLVVASRIAPPRSLMKKDPSSRSPPPTTTTTTTTTTMTIRSDHLIIPASLSPQKLKK